MIVVGITGGIGSGKSTILRRMKEAYGAYTIQADKVGHHLMKPGNPCYQPIIQLLGREILDETGSIDRKKVGGIVFSNPVLLNKLNKIIHPAVKDFILDKLEKKRQEGCRLFVVEAALLLEDHYDEICDDLWYIYVDCEIRGRRLKEERGYSSEKIRDIMSNQLTDAIFRERCNYVIVNNGDFEETYKQIDKRVRSYEIM